MANGEPIGHIRIHLHLFFQNSSIGEKMPIP